MMYGSLEKGVIYLLIGVWKMSMLSHIGSNLGSIIRVAALNVRLELILVMFFIYNISITLDVSLIYSAVIKQYLQRGSNHIGHLVDVHDSNHNRHAPELFHLQMRISFSFLPSK